MRDYYKFWSKNKKQEFEDREKIVVSLTNNIHKNNPEFKIIDLGGGDGKVLEQIHFKNKTLADISPYQLEIAKKRGLITKKCNLTGAFPFKDEEFDIAISMEFIEHILDPDSFLEECNRILKKDGYLIITTPNLCAWYNRLLVPLGIQPISVESSTRKKKIGTGFVGKFMNFSEPMGHIRVFNKRALEDLLIEYGFGKIRFIGTIASGFPKSIDLINKFLKFHTGLCSSFVIICKKMNDLKL